MISIYPLQPSISTECFGQEWSFQFFGREMDINFMTATHGI